jgi:iron complex outermembrane receptor protein
MSLLLSKKAISQRLKGVLCATVAVTGLIGVREAIAQSEGASASATSALEEIVVTARRREERVQSIPLAITAFSGQQIENNHIMQGKDLIRTVPSLSTSRLTSDPNAPSSGNLRLRGLPGAISYFADVPIGSTDFSPLTQLNHGSGAGLYYDLDTVEVIKGPQGTLFGMNSVGGLVSLSPKKPGNEYDGYVQATFGNYSDREFEGAINIPIVADKLLVRIAGQTQQRDGYTTVISTGKDLDNRDSYAWRVGVTFRPTDNIENYLLYDGYYQHTNGSSIIPTFINPAFSPSYSRWCRDVVFDGGLGFRSRLIAAPVSSRFGVSF